MIYADCGAADEMASTAAAIDRNNEAILSWRVSIAVWVDCGHLRGSFKGPATAEFCCAKQEVLYACRFTQARQSNELAQYQTRRVTDEGKSQTLRLFDGFQKRNKRILQYLGIIEWLYRVKRNASFIQVTAGYCTGADPVLLLVWGSSSSINFLLSHFPLELNNSRTGFFMSQSTDSSDRRENVSTT